MDYFPRLEQELYNNVLIGKMEADNSIGAFPVNEFQLSTGINQSKQQEPSKV